MCAGTKKTKWQRIYDDLSSKIHQFRVGENFYTIDEISKSYNVSKITAIKVLEEFEKEGLVEKIRRRGTIVKKSPNSKLKIYLVIPKYASVDVYVHSPIGVKLYSGLILAIEEIGADLSVISEEMMCSSVNELFDNDSGVIFFQRASKETVEVVRKESIPYLFLHPPCRMKTGPSVRINIRYGGYIGTKYLIELGHRRIGFAGAGVAAPYILPRFKGYLKALKEEGIKFSWNYVREVSEERDPVNDFVLEELFSLPEPPTALFASSDRVAMNIIEYCNKRGIRIPTDVSIVGYDNLDESAMVEPALTTIETYLKDAGRKAILLLNKLILSKELYHKNKIRDMVIVPELIVRDSAKSFSQ